MVHDIANGHFICTFTARNSPRREKHYNMLYPRSCDAVVRGIKYTGQFRKTVLYNSSYNIIQAYRQV